MQDEDLSRYISIAMIDLPIPPPTELKLHRRSRELEVRFADGSSGRATGGVLAGPLALRRGQRALGAAKACSSKAKRASNIARIEPVGSYAVRLVFDDGHDTGLYTWPILYELCSERDRKWQRYLERLAAAGHARRAD